MKNLSRWSIAGAVFTLLIGTLLHFVYDWFGGTIWAVLGAVNESTWEHLKLVFWPIVLFAVVEWFAYGRNTPGFWPAKAWSVLIAMAAIVVLFYTYTGILGYNLMAVDIATFVIGTILAYCFACRRLNQKKGSSAFAMVMAVLLLLALTVGFAVFTYAPPHLGLFLDPVSGSYGI